MDIVAFIDSFRLFDLLLIAICLVMFVIGFVQGSLRRVLGIASILFSFLVAANLRDPLGSFFAQNWRQFPAQYSYMIAFGFVFALATIAFSLVIQGFYKHQRLFARAPAADEILGGVLGLVQAFFVMGFVIVILDSFFRQPGSTITSGELPFLRTLWDAFDASGTAQIFRSTLIPGFFAVFGGLVPPAVAAFI